jgi:CRP-like cAMP-binding protein
MGRARIEALQRTAMFGAIDDAIVELILDRARSVEVAKGDCFFREGDRGSSAYLLESGSVSILKAWGDEQYRLRGLSAGDCFGEVALLDFGARSASVQADVDARAIEISALDLQVVSRHDPVQFALIYMNLGRELSRRLRDADARLFRARFRPSDAADGYASAAALL